MRHFIERTLTSLLIVATAAACVQKENLMTPEEAKRIEQITEDMAPRCVGRYLIDLPSQFVPNAVTRAEIDGATLKVYPISAMMFQRGFIDRKKQLEESRLPGKKSDRPVLKTTIFIDKDHPELGGIFDRAANVNSSDRMNRSLELFAWKDGYAIEAVTKATDTTFPEDADDSIAKQLRTDTPEKVDLLRIVFQRTRGRSDTEIPREQGVCIANGFVSGPPTDDEWVEINHHLASARDVYTTFVSMSHIGPEENTLLERGRELEQALQDANGKTLRKGEREANGLHFQEWTAERESGQNPGLTVYQMYLEANSESGNAEEPLVAFELNSGIEKPGPTRSLEETATREPISKATLNAAQSMALWDKITATIRPRPGAF